MYESLSHCQGCVSPSGVVKTGEIINTEKVPSDSDPPCNAFWKVSDCQQLYFQHVNDNKNTANAVKPWLDRKTHNVTLSFTDWSPQCLKLFEALKT